MCMLIFHPATAKPFSRAEWFDFHERNPHGFGAIWRAPGGEVRWKKGLMRPEETWTLYRALYANGCREAVFHWRFRTAGPVNVENCHPLVAAGDVLVAHNGANIGRSTAEKSDTACFVEDWLDRPLTIDPTLVHHRPWVERLDRQIGSGNKVILWWRGARSPVVVGEDRGLWYRERWYSNTYAWSAPAAATRSAKNRPFWEL